MFLSNLTDRGAAPALVKTLAFNEARLRMLGENVANLNTPNYRTKQLDVKGFQLSLRDALNRRQDQPSAHFVVSSGRQVRTDPNGFLQVQPTERPVENLVFHDGTNSSIERQMADLAETGMSHALGTHLLQGHYDRLRRAIRGT